MTSNFPILEDSVTEIRAQVAEGNEDSDKKKGGGIINKNLLLRH